MYVHNCKQITHTQVCVFVFIREMSLHRYILSIVRWLYDISANRLSSRPIRRMVMSPPMWMPIHSSIRYTEWCAIIAGGEMTAKAIQCAIGYFTYSCSEIFVCGVCIIGFIVCCPNDICSIRNKSFVRLAIRWIRACIICESVYAVRCENVSCGRWNMNHALWMIRLCRLELGRCFPFALRSCQRYTIRTWNPHSICKQSMHIRCA